MQPSPEAIAWGKRQASKSPRWNDARWREVAAIFQVTFLDEGQDDEQSRDVA
ncbi:hypothetical protein GCM10010468_44350 [Actinocorallia longicatena]|uniref:Transposase of IS4/5 family DUF4096 n=1 Tax=Actinocorallia longicatena TaxID=111803 RepID=A0ABP6QDM1_9ACTN